MKKQVKTSRLRLLALAVLLLGAVSCSDDMQPVPPGESVPVQVEAGLADEVVTRAGDTPITTEGAQIGVFRTTQNGYTAKYNVKYTYRTATSSWSAASGELAVDSRAAKLTAYYDPNNVVTFASATSAETEPLALALRQYDATKLWYYDLTAATITSANARIAFGMKQAYARLTFSLSRNADYPAACKVTRIAITSAGGTIFTAAKANLIDGTVTGCNSSSSYTLSTFSWAMGTGGIAPGVTDTSAELLVPPQTCNGLKVTLTVDGKGLSVTIPADKFPEFAAGTRYTVEVQISGAGVSAVTIPDSWTGSEIKDGSDPYIPVP